MLGGLKQLETTHPWYGELGNTLYCTSVNSVEAWEKLISWAILSVWM
jgi:hypothetical protein